MPLIDEEYCRALLAKTGDTSPACPSEPSEGTSLKNDARKSVSSERTERRPSESAQSADSEGDAEKADTAQDAFKRILKLCQVRERSAQEMRTRLAKEGYGEPAIEEAIARACGCSLIDDMRFADMLIRSRTNAGKGMAGIAAELERNGIEASQVPGWTEDYSPDSEQELTRALDLLERRPPSAKNKRDAAYRRLVSKGFSSAIASSAARQWNESSD